MRVTITFLILLCSTAGFACYNEYYALDSKGHFHQVEVSMINFQKNFDLQKIERKLVQLEKELQTKADFKLLSDYGLYLVKGGKVKEARIIFEALAKAYPNEYSIIANLGTTYELLGENEKALEYIRKGLKLNPNSHGGSEWIHVKILLTKIGFDKDPNYMKEHDVLALTPKQEASNAVRKQLYTQLKERFPFCKGPDPIMADLFIELGDCYAETLSFEHAKGLYQIAKKYYMTDRRDVDEKIEQVRKLRAKYAHLSPSEHYTEEEQKMGMVSKIDGVPYESYLEDPNSDNYTINWSKIETDPDKLLALVGLERIEEEDEQKPTEKDTAVKPKLIAESITTVKTFNYSTLVIGLTLMVFVIAIFTYFKTKRNKKR